MNATLPIGLAGAYRACEALAASHYENFPVASILLPPAARPHVAALYAFARTADDFADEPSFEGRRLKELKAWESGLRSALKGGKAPPILQAFAHTLRTFSIPTALPLALLKAFRMDVTIKRYKDWAALLHYCRHSADPVGRMVLLILGHRDPALARLSDRICSGLQLINFWQDASVDLPKGRIYFPRDEWKEAGVTELDLLAGRDTEGTRALVRRVLDHTESLFRSGFPLPEKVQGRLRLELRATCFGGLSILNKVRAMDYNVLHSRPKLGAWDKARIGFQTLLGSMTPLS